VIPYIHPRGSPGRESVLPRLSATGECGTKKTARLVSRELMSNDDLEGKRRNGCYVVRGAWCVVGVKALGTGRYFARAVSFLLLLISLRAFAANGETFGVLQVGESTYQNVKVTTKAKDYIFIVHSSGMTSIKVKELPDDIREKLGYAHASMPKPQANEAEASTRPTVAKGDGALIQEMQTKFSQAWHRAGLASKIQVLRTYPELVVLAAALLLMAYLFCSYCCMLICRKTGNDPGILVWLPLLQAVTMLRAASMSTWWFGALFVPGLNLLLYVLWCIRIVEARQKTKPLSILLLFPLSGWFAFMFLAFSKDSREEGLKMKVEIMTLEPAWTSGSRRGVRVLMECERHIAA